ncbi:MAG: tyrosine-type recombinase/integrase [Deltaproteobacteria bacterium]|nr:tyrosine-type recombinase/integrase [Deltaproteobacteria bacterium]
MGKLTAAFLRAVKEPGRYGDGGTLFFRVAPGGSKSWIQRLTFDGRRHDIGLGSFPVIGLADARERAFANRVKVAHGENPLAEKRRSVAPTFREAADRTLEATKGRWRNGKTEKIWKQVLAKRAFPAFGDRRVDAITREDVLTVVAPIWTDRPEVARRLRQFIRATLAWAQAHGFVEVNVAGEAIDGALPAMAAVKEHYRALPYSELPATLAGLGDGIGRGVAARLCLRFLVLTAVRSGEARGALWSEIDLEARTWTIPAERMKMANAHTVPLSDAALAVLEQARMLDDGSGLVFPSPMKRNRELSSMTLTKLLRDAGLADRATVHGFRSAFRTWASERTNADHATMELALAHAVGSAVERSYARSDLLEKRRRLMDQWGAFVSGQGSAKVINLR